MEEATEELKQTVSGKIEPAVDVDIIPAPKLPDEISNISKGNKRWEGSTHIGNYVDGSVGSKTGREA